MSERLAQSLLLGGLILLPVKGLRAEPPKDPIYVKTSTGWNAAYALFTLKFDKAGNWKVVEMHRLSKKELKEER